MRKLTLLVLCALGLSAFQKTTLCEASPDLSQFNEVWAAYEDNGLDDRAYCVAIDSENNIVVVGPSVIGEDNYVYLYKYNSKGKLLWSLPYFPGIPASVTSVAVDSNDNIFVGGKIESGPSADANLLKFSPDGDFVWQKRIDHGGKGNDTYGLAIDSNNNIILGGTFNDTGTQYDDDYYVIKMANDGTILWRQTHVTSGHDIAQDLVIDSQNNIIQCGQSPYYGLHVVKYDENGAKLWDQGYYTGYFGEGHRVTVDSQNNIYVTGDYKYTNNIVNFRTIKYDPFGNRLWIRDYDTGGRESASGIAVDQDGFVYVVGNMLDDYDVLIVVYDANGNLVDTKRIETNYFEAVTYARFDKNWDLVTSGMIKEDFYWDTKITKYSYSLPNNPPVLNPIGNQTGSEGQVLEFTISASDPDPNDTLTFSGANLPPGAVFDSETACFLWTPEYNQAGNYENVEFSVTDNGDPVEVDAELITITIGNVNRPPEFSPVGSQAVLEGELLEFAVTAVDPDGDGIVLWTNSLPQGSTFDTITGTFLWMPDNSQSGNYTVVFYATDYGTPNLTGQIEVVTTVGDVPTPTELADQLVDSVVGLDFDKELENSYLANLKKVNKFMEIGNVTAAINQIDAFIQKIEQDIVSGNISEIEGNILIDAATFLRSQLTDPLTWPLPGSPNDREVTLNFGADWLVSCGGLIKKHTGIDVSAEAGEYVYAAYGGEVKAIVDGRQDGWAYAVTIEHTRDDDLFTTVYWHIDPLVGYGTVRKGQKIGTVGDLGSNTHLHFGVRLHEYSNISNRGALPQTECDGDPAFPEKFVNPSLLTYEK